MDKPSDKFSFLALILIAIGCLLMLGLSTGIVLFASTEIQDTELCKEVVKALTIGWQGGFAVIGSVLATRLGLTLKRPTDT